MGIGDIAISGMQAAMTNMETISNNIANANTVGFKSSNANFADLFPVNGGATGLGVTLASVQQNFTAGSPVLTNVGTDLAIKNNGFFVMRDSVSGQVSYTRAGRFEFSQGYLVNGTQRVQGLPAVNGAIPSGTAPVDLLVPTAPQPATATANITPQNLNLNSGDAIIATPFSATDSTTYNYQTVSQVYDSLGSLNQINTYYTKTADNTWSVNVVANGTPVATGGLTFNPNGTLLSATGLNAISYSPTTGAVAPQTLNMNFAATNTNQFAKADTSTTFTVDGSQAGNYTGFQITSDGKVYAQYDNSGQTLVGQVAVANFISPSGLQPIGDMSWTATTSSGPASINAANSNGNINPGYLEQSNVDLSSEMVNLINAQNSFQANAQVEQTYNQVMQTVTKL